MRKVFSILAIVATVIPGIASAKQYQIAVYHQDGSEATIAEKDIAMKLYLSCDRQIKPQVGRPFDDESYAYSLTSCVQLMLSRGRMMKLIPSGFSVVVIPKKSTR